MKVIQYGLSIILGVFLSYTNVQAQVYESELLKQCNPPAFVQGDESIKKYCEETEKKSTHSHLELFLRCNGKDGNADFGFDSGDPEYYKIDENGKCKYEYPNHGGH